jgi:hypothetical protein
MNHTPVNHDKKKTGPQGHAAAGDDAAAVEELRREFGGQWDIARITGGYRAVLRETRGYTAIPRYGSSPAKLAASIRSVDRGR